MIGFKIYSVKLQVFIQKIMQEGTMDAGAWSCGMVAGLIHDIPTCKELIDRVISEAEEIINNRQVNLRLLNNFLFQGWWSFNTTNKTLRN